MLDALRWPLCPGKPETSNAPTRPGVAARFGGDDGSRPVLLGVVQGPVAVEMAKDALAEAGIPAYIRANSLGTVYGLAIGSFGSGEVWVLPELAEPALEILIGIGVLPPSGEDSGSAAT
jgi:hypothetical protein